ncbi:MAG: hypothetical protein GEU80_13025 [Dehalococcoidia bacterium]|nr:hypothetical protein [Dehalococcoidia bacterium]
MRRGTALLALAIAALTLATGCSGDNAAGETPETGAFVRMLRLVPDEPRYRAAVHIGDLDRAIQLAGIDRSQEAFERYLMDQARGNAAATVHIPLPRFGQGVLGLRREALMSEYERLQRYFGIGFADIDQWVEAGQPSGQLFGAAGAFDPQQAEERLAACEECPPAHRREHGDVGYYAWGGDFEQNLSSPLGPPAFDRLGRGGRVAILDEYALRAVWDEGIESMLDALDGTGSLADDRDFRLLATNLEDLGALGATLTDQTTSPEMAEAALNIGVFQDDPALRAAAERAWSTTEGPPVLRPYVALAAGPGHDGDEAYTAVVIVHETKEAARENAGRLGPRIEYVGEQLGGAEQRIFARYERIEAEADGRVVRARLYGRPGWPEITPLPMVPLFLHE